MCLYPKLIKNPKYKSTKKNNYTPPTCTDERVKWVPIGCQQCMECKKKRSREWQVRLLEHIKTHTNGKFITFTFNNESYEKIYNQVREADTEEKLDQYERDNQVATIAIRRFLERWRKTYKKSVQHWFVTELGQTNTERIHIHGIIWTDETIPTIQAKWIEGHSWIGSYVNQRTVNYIVKYINKIDGTHRYYKPKTLCSAGIGSNYTKTFNARTNRFDSQNTKETYRTPTGHKISLPIYWRNKIYTEQEREKLWIYKIDKQIRWVMSEKVDVSKGEQEYYKLLEHYQRLNKTLGYNDDTIDWNKKQYEQQRRNANLKISLAKKYKRQLST